MKIKFFPPTQLSLAVVATLLSGQAMSAGFALNDHSATASGNALAGAAASRSDISFSFWNPALFTNAKSKELYVSGAYVMPDMDVTVNSASSPDYNTMTGGQIPVPAQNLGNKAPGNVVDDTFVPSIYFAYPLSDKTVVGASLNVPFGLSGEYGDEWAGRYHSAKTGVKDISLSASIAHQLNNSLSVGGSIQVHRGEVQLDSAIRNPLSPNDDGYGSLEADDIAYAFSFGAMYEPVKGTRLGLGYRSDVDFEFEGDAEYSKNIGVVAKGAGIDNAAISDNLTFPSVLTLSAEHELNSKLTLGVTAMRTGWSSLDEMRIKFEKGEDGKSQNDTVLSFEFEDQWFYSVGANYQASDKLILRTGLAVDNSPATDEYRSARTPDGDRKWLSLGASYDFGRAGEITAAYTRVDIDDVSVIRDGSFPNGSTEDAPRGQLDADYESSANVFSFAYNVSF